MADDTTRAIDRFFDVVDDGVDKVTRVLNRTQRADAQLRAQSKRRVVINAEARERRKAPSSSTEIVARPRYRIVESIDPKSGNTIFVVTDGNGARTECTTREFATQILKALEKTP